MLYVIDRQLQEVLKKTQEKETKFIQFRMRGKLKNY